MPERHYLIVHCKKLETYLPMKLSSPPNPGLHPADEVMKDSVCVMHNGEMDRVKNKYQSHGSVSILVSINANPLDKEEDVVFAAIDQAIIRESQQN